MSISDVRQKKINTSDSPDMRAWRLKRVRNLANLSREQMCKDGEIKRNTLIGWENARFGGLTSSGAAKVIEKITQEGVHCTLEWLMYGIGSEPSVNPIPFNPEGSHLESNEDIQIAYELAFFKSKNLHAVYLLIDGEEMYPQYRKADWVAGKRKTGKDIQLTIGLDCIVQTEKGEILLRNIREGDEPDTFTLVCSNPLITNKRSVIANVKLVFAAPVIWHRRKDIL
jgi:transcriptional regulator with XRE-family HTH domain